MSSQKSNQSLDQIDQLVRKIVDSLALDVPVGVSARHIHLSRQHLDILFGTGYQLRQRHELMGGQYAAEECVTIVGANLRAIEKVRILGPERAQTQVEISATDKVRLGGTAPITIIGTKGAVYLSQGGIIAPRHIHMPPDIARAANVCDGDLVSIKIDGERGIIFDNIKIRIDPTFTLEMHIDTDEANACGLKTGDIVKLIKGKRSF
jgi:putative phosphotransacetylase